jgi:phage terminase large subunit-like protein
MLSMGRKNGKTGLAAALALAHLCGPEAIISGQVLSGAADRNQASIIFQAMQKMALLNEDIANRLIFREYNKTIEDVETGSMYTALSSDAKKAHGLSPNFFVADEVAQWRDRELLDALRTGMGAHAEPLGLIISTRSPDPDNPLEELIRYTEDVKEGIIHDPTFYGAIFSAPMDADPWAEKTWALANPALGDFRSLVDVRVQAQQAQRIPSQEAPFRAYILNQPVAVEERWLNMADWEACNAPPEPVGACYGGLDLSTGPADLTAFSLYWPASGALKTWTFLPTAGLDGKAKEDNAPYPLWKQQGHVILVPGRVIDRVWLGSWIANQTQGLELRGIASDRWGLEALTAEMEREGINLPWESHGAGYKDVSPSLIALERAIIDHRLQHGANPVLKWAASNASVDMDPAGNRKLSKQHSRGRIDPIISALYAVGLAARQPPAPAASFWNTLETLDY